MIITECFIPVSAVKTSWLMILHTRQNVLVCIFTCFVLIVFLFLFLLFGRMLLVVAMRRSGSGRKFADLSQVGDCTMPPLDDDKRYPRISLVIVQRT